MRTEKEVRDMLAALERIGASWEKVVARNESQEQVEEAIVAFNGNSRLVSALKWMLGEDTLVYTYYPQGATEVAEVELEG